MMMNEYYKLSTILLLLMMIGGDNNRVHSFAPSSKQPLLSPQRFLLLFEKNHHLQNNNNNNKHTSNLKAIIYGWDGDDSDETVDISTPSYVGVDSQVGPEDCPAEGLEVAKKLSDDRTRMGSFARLAAAFSPPERGISIQDIEKVEVTCVREDKIELEAVLCEAHGCITLSVPIQFPKECDGDPNLGCAIQNLDTLDIRAETMVMHMQATIEELSLDNADLSELVELNDKMSLPNWWVSVDLDANLAKECQSIQSLLNEAEFHPEIVALAQDGMEKNANLGNGWETVTTSDYVVQRAKVAAVGPAGILIKVAAIQQSAPGRGTQYLDVAYPFSATMMTPIKDAAALRANVLGVIAAVDTSTSSTTSGGGVRQAP